MKWFYTSGMRIVCCITLSSCVAMYAEDVKDPNPVLSEDRKKLIKELFNKGSEFVIKELKTEAAGRFGSGIAGGTLMTGDSVLPNEKKFVDQRQNVVHKGLAKMFGEYNLKKYDINDHLDLNIGIVLAGNQISGLTGTVGFLKELKAFLP